MTGTEFNLSDPAVHADPYPTYARMRAEAPVHRDEATGMWWLFRHADCEEALRSTRLGSPMGPPEAIGQRLGAGPAARYVGGWMLAQNPPEHGRLRRLVSQAFTPRAVEAMRPRVEGLVDDLLGRLPGEFDVMADVAYRVPVAVICSMLGIPGEHHDRFRRLTEENAAVIEPMPSPEQVAAADRASAELTGFVAGIAAERRRRPSDDLLSGLVAAREEGRGLSDEELTANVGLLLAAGYSTTMHLIGNTLSALLRHPDQLALVRDDPARAGGAVEETLRWEPPIQMWGRTALVDVDLGGVTVPAGSPVFSVVASANRDPAVFADPDRFDVTRPAPRHLTFGGGVHHCLGSGLGRLEAEVTVRALLTRFPKLEAAGAGLPAGTPGPPGTEWIDNVTMRGLRQLRVAV